MRQYILGVTLTLVFAFSGCQTEDVKPIPGSNQSKVSLSTNVPSIAEQAEEATITATLSTPSADDVSVTLSYLGSATLATDYNGFATISIPAGELTGNITVRAIQDTIKEGNEIIQIDIAFVTGATEDEIQSVSIIIEDDDVPLQANLIVNEILYDPSNSGLDGDANGDGTYAQNEDEFIEFVNLSSQPLDMSGYEIYDTKNLELNEPNHKVPAGTVIQPGKALVVFGGGAPNGSFGGSTVQTSTTGNLNLNNAGDEMTLKDAGGKIILSVDIEPWSNNPNESYTRNPDLTGNFEQHSANNTTLFSPGTKVDGGSF